MRNVWTSNASGSKHTLTDAAGVVIATVKCSPVLSLQPWYAEVCQAGRRFTAQACRTERGAKAWAARQLQ